MSNSYIWLYTQAALRHRCDAVYEKMDRSNNGRVEEDVSIRVQMGKRGFYWTLSMMEGNKAQNAEDFLKYRASKPSGRIRFCIPPVYWTVPLQTLHSKCGWRFYRPWQQISGGWENYDDQSRYSVIRPRFEQHTRWIQLGSATASASFARVFSPLLQVCAA